MFFSQVELDAVRRYYSGLGDAPATPLRQLPGLAADLGLADVCVKDESDRFGLQAFKIVGVRYAVARLLETGLTGDLACATTGNHGRAVARAARLAGHGAHVFVPRDTVPVRVTAIQGEGAEVIVTSVDYDETVRVMADGARERGWTVVSDTAWEGYEQVPKWIMTGYAWILDEAAAAWGTSPPDLVVVQAGVGSLAGGVAGWLEATLGPSRPRLVIVEPEGSACVAASLSAGELVTLASCAPTSMAGLRCAEVSSVAWPVLRDTVDATVQVSDDDVRRTVDRLGSPSAGDPLVASGASGAAGVAGLIRLLQDPSHAAARRTLGITRETRALVFNTEGPTEGLKGH